MENGAVTVSTVEREEVVVEDSQREVHGDVDAVLEEFGITELEERLEFDGWCGGWDVNFFC